MSEKSTIQIEYDITYSGTSIGETSSIQRTNYIQKYVVGGSTYASIVDMLTLAAGASKEYDLSSYISFNGDTLGMDSVYRFSVGLNKSVNPGIVPDGDIEIGGAVSNPWAPWAINATDVFKIPSFGAFGITATNSYDSGAGGGISIGSVSGLSKVIKITNTSTMSVVVNVTIIGTLA